MWKLWITGAFGLGIVAVNFMVLSPAVLQLSLIVMGLGITFLSTWTLMEEVPEGSDWERARNSVFNMPMVNREPLS